ncbi:MAG: 4Fe-4S binding protein [Methanoregula sp.]|uniref:4Fe-4S binding protein n=1 Tax=Methanoregula sp. TaxID=2052170 RepID=UPI0025DABF71|nr:4Fe-4S binding protein [Methanoregula sp.]MCK9631263.1 4Fe-4S binding protein [Methanoregula sp.]
MQFTKKLRRGFATLLLSAGLAYPACAAICPRGHSGCPSPGRCFLFTDADGNSLCDYTAGSGSSSFGSPGESQPATPANSLDTSTAHVQSTAGSGLDSLSISVIITGAVLFALLSIVIYLGIRKGTGGIKIDRRVPALTLSTLVALGISLMAMSILTGSGTSGMVFALIYITAGTLLTSYLWYAGVMTRRITLALAAESTLAGFVFLAPVMPLEFIGIVNSITAASSVTPAIIILCAVIAITFIIGRTFCGHLCPVGSLQELAYEVPVKKIDIRRITIFETIRLGVFAATIIAAVYLVDLMAYTGLFELFSLSLSAVLIVAAGLILLSVFLYRPVCRILCPFGVLFSLLGGFSLFRLRRSESCIGCKKCEKACPVHAAGADDPKRECYLCGRCTDNCPVETAISYRR